jgi:predicted HicB family RNase H-like nuclease
MSKLYDRYTYRVTWSEEDQEYVGLCSELASISWLEKSAEAALIGIRKLAKECISDMVSQGEAVPKAMSVNNYSGKFMVRVPPELHRALALQAAESGVSLNRIISNKLAN